MIRLGNLLAQKHREKFIGSILGVLVEGEKNGFWQGFTSNYLKIYLKSNRVLSNRIVRVRLIELYRDGLRGAIH